MGRPRIPAPPKRLGRYQDGARTLRPIPMIGRAPTRLQQAVIRPSGAPDLDHPGPHPPQFDGRDRAMRSPPRRAQLSRPPIRRLDAAALLHLPASRDAGAIGSVGSFSRPQRPGNISFPPGRRRVGRTRFVMAGPRRMRAITPGAASRPMWPAQDNSPSGSINREFGGAPPSGSSITSVGADIGRGSPAGCATVGRQPKRGGHGRRQPSSAAATHTAPTGRPAWCRAEAACNLIHHHAGRGRANIAGASGSDKQHRQAFRCGQQGCFGGAARWRLPRAIGRRVRRYGFSIDHPAKPHLLHRGRVRFARDVSGRQRLQRTDITEYGGRHAGASASATSVGREATRVSSCPPPGRRQISRHAVAGRWRPSSHRKAGGRRGVQPLGRRTNRQKGFRQCFRSNGRFCIGSGGRSEALPSVRSCCIRSKLGSRRCCRRGCTASPAAFFIDPTRAVEARAVITPTRIPTHGAFRATPLRLLGEQPTDTLAL